MRRHSPHDYGPAIHTLESCRLCATISNKGTVCLWENKKYDNETRSRCDDKEPEYPSSARTGGKGAGKDRTKTRSCRDSIPKQYQQDGWKGLSMRTWSCEVKQ
ncbi:hypothetical protein E5D57_002390 [Metarhizium anisopliae]|nr:hypothetical protein E5D57_002390 [Metarhizium anisopliae]